MSQEHNSPIFSTDCDTNLNQANKALVQSMWACMDAITENDVLGSAHPLYDFLIPNVKVYGFDPLGDLIGCDAYVQDYLLPLKHAFPDIQRDIFIFYGGRSNGRQDGNFEQDGAYWVTGTGNLRATFTNDYFGIPATGNKVNIRWGEFCKVEDNRVTEIYFLLDMVDLMQQAGMDVLPPAMGKDGRYAPPRAGDGVLHDSANTADSDYTLAHMRRFIYEGLNGFDENDLSSMGMADYFHPDVIWYGPGGIGACYSFKEFESFHQQPWLIAFPDRSVQDLQALIAEGQYSGGPGWAGVIATHTGEYKGVAPTGNPIVINGLDWWKREGEQLVENWVFVDMVHLFRQMGVNLL